MSQTAAKERARNAYGKQKRRLKDQERERLIREHLHLVKRIAYGILCRLPSDVDADDLMSAGAVGLLNAVDRFDASRGKSFESFAKFRIRGAILDELRGLDYMSRGRRKQAREVERVAHSLEQELGRGASEQEMADALGMEVGDFQGVLEDTRSAVFLDVQDLGLESRSRCDELRSILGEGRDGEPYDNVLLHELRERVVAALSGLSDAHRTVISLYYFSELNFKEIGRVLERTESRICQLHGKALIELRERLRKEDEKKEQESRSRAQSTSAPGPEAVMR